MKLEQDENDENVGVFFLFISSVRHFFSEAYTKKSVALLKKTINGDLSFLLGL